MAVTRRNAPSYPRSFTKGLVPASGPVEVNWEHPLANGLKNLWLNNGNYGQALDLAGGATGSLVGPAIWQSSSKGPVLATQSSGYINIGSGFGYPSVTVVTWANPHILTNNYSAIFSRVSAAGSDYYQVFVRSSGKLALYSNIGSGPTYGYDATGANTILIDKWAHVVATFGIDGMAGYVDGVLDATATCGAIDTGSVIAAIGQDTTNPGRNFDGLIGPVSLYNRALSQAEVSWLRAEPAAMLRPVVRRSYYGGTSNFVVPRRSLLMGVSA